MVRTVTLRRSVRRSAVLVGLAVASTCVGAPEAEADPQVVASVAANVPIAAHAGWVVWSARSERGWVLMAWHDGVTTALPAAPRPQPFDVDLGTDRRGRTVLTFSRCTRTPRLTFDGHPAAWTGGGCRLRVLDLARGRERRAAVPRRAGSSDTSPSMWRGRIAFARNGPRNRMLSRVMLWSPRDRRLTRLRGGAFRSKCTIRGGCRGVPIRGAVESLDLGARAAAFLWWVEGPSVIGHGGWEVRADHLAGHRSVLAGSGFVGEACTGGADSVVPSAPAVDGASVWYLVRRSICYRNDASLVRFGLDRGRGVSGAVPGEILQFAKDRDSFYALEAPHPQGEVQPTCALPGQPCSLVRIDRPAQTRRLRRPRSPFG